MAIDHICIEVPLEEIDEAVKAYLAALGPLGYSLHMRIGVGGIHADTAPPDLCAVGLGAGMGPDFWICTPHKERLFPEWPGLHLGFSASTRKAVRLFHQAALESEDAKGVFTCNGPPGPRPLYHPSYYAAFLKDKWGNRMEAVCHMPASIDAIRTSVTDSKGVLFFSLVVGVGCWFATKYLALN
ncbi:hypothetical protein FRC03_007804 [Tulasnella sp. 419]|nr:hypothetical protein FRC02_010199 [Tulasnella sp. 418]KAG8959557.1 hypothetical protein FRC03_007804 [Tulasnella sp. 419]